MLTEVCCIFTEDDAPNSDPPVEAKASSEGNSVKESAAGVHR